MRRIAPLAVLVLAAVLVPAGRVAAEAWLKIPGIQGGSRDPMHPGELEVDSMQIATLQGAAAGAARGSGGAGKVTLHDFHFTMKADKASPILMKAAATGVRYPEVTLTCRKAGGGQQDYLVVTMKDVLVSSYQSGGQATGGEIVPADSFTLVAGSAEFHYAGPPSGPKVPGAMAAPAVVHVAPTAKPVPKITGASASAPVLGLAVKVAITSTGPCTNAYVDFGDGSISEGHAVTGNSIIDHVYATPGVKKIRVGGYDAPYWTGSGKQKVAPRSGNDCTGWAPEIDVTLRSAAVAAPAGAAMPGVLRPIGSPTPVPPR